MLSPNIQKKKTFLLKECARCGASCGPEHFSPCRSPFYPDGVLPICNDCVEKILQEDNFSWDAVNLLCQCANIPFIPKEWTKIWEMNGEGSFPVYAKMVAQTDYQGVNWGDYEEYYKELHDQHQLEQELPEVSEQIMKKRKDKWGYNYDDEELAYLENLYNGLMTTQNVNGALQVDQALKICKMSLEIDKKIREGSDFDKLLSSYDKLVKAAEFTPRNVKNLNDFDTCGELIKWLEKTGWKNKFYDDVSRDVVDECMKNIQNFNQRLYINESGISDDINARIEQLKSAKELENSESYYGTDRTYDLDAYDDEGYSGLFKEDEEFEVGEEDDKY